MDDARNASKNPNITKRKRIVWIAVLSVLFIVELCIAAFVCPGFLIEKKYTPQIEVSADDGLPELAEEDYSIIREEESNERVGASDIRFGKTGNTSVLEVSSEKSVVTFENGVNMDFGSCLLSEKTQKVSVERLGTSYDEMYEAEGYDFLIDGGDATFEGIVAVTIPYPKTWGDNVFVQYYDEQTGTWEIFAGEPNGDGTVTFYTDHFCTYAAFRRKVERGTSASGKLIEEIPGVDEYQETVRINWDVLAKMVREGQVDKEASLADLTSQGNSYFADRMITTLSNANTGLDYLAKASKMPGLSSKVLGPLGQALTIGKFMYQGHKYGWSKSISDNGTDLVMLGVGMASSAPPPVGPACMAITAGYYLYSTTSAIATDIGNSGWNSVAEYAYRDFSTKYLIYNKVTGQIGARYVKDASEDAATPFHKDYIPLSSGASGADTANWYTVFEDAIAREKAGKLGKYRNAGEYVEHVIEEYVTAFWRLSPKMKDRYLSNTPTSGVISPLLGVKLKADYKAPSKADQDLYVENFRKDLCAWLKPYFEKELDQQYANTMNAVWKHFYNLENTLNAKYTVKLTVPGKQYFTDSEYYGHTIGLSTGEKEIPGIYLDQMYGTVTFTGAAWIKAGCPTYLRIMGSRSKPIDNMVNYFVKVLNLSPGLNEVVLEPEEIAGTYSLSYMDDRGIASRVLENGSPALKEALESSKLVVMKDGSFSLTGSGSRSLEMPKSYMSGLIPPGDEEADPDPVEWTQMDGSCTITFELKGRIDESTGKGNASLSGTGKLVEKYTYGHKSGKTSSSNVNGTATFSGSTQSVVRKTASEGEDLIYIDFFIRKENGETIYDLNTETTITDSDGTEGPEKIGWWLSFCFRKDT